MFIFSAPLYADMETDFEVSPGLNVEVGEEVLLDASILYSLNDESDANMQEDDLKWADLYIAWKYGDGTPYLFEEVDPRSGMATIHFFMKPSGAEGFPVTMSVNRREQTGVDANNNPVYGYVEYGSVTKNIIVTGQTPPDGFEIWHAPFTSRIAQYLYIQIPEFCRNTNHQLTLSLSGNSYTETTLLSETSDKAEIRYKLNQAALPTNEDYVLTAKLTNTSTSSVVGIIREKFSKKVAKPKLSQGGHR